MSQWTSWFDRLTQQGGIRSSHPLMPEGQIVSWEVQKDEWVLPCIPGLNR
jgi:hypothetical protein